MIERSPEERCALLFAVVRQLGMLGEHEAADAVQRIASPIWVSIEMQARRARRNQAMGARSARPGVPPQNCAAGASASAALFAEAAE